MRVLHLIETLGRGGAEQALLNLLPALREEGIESSVLSLWGARTLEPDLRARGIEVHQLNPSHRWSLPEAALRLRRHLDAHPCDVLCGHLYFGQLYAAMACTSGRPSISVFHNQGYSHAPPKTRWEAIRFQMGKRANHRAAAHVGVSRAAALDAEHHLGLAHVTVIPNALSLESLSPEPNLDTAGIRARMGCSGSELLVLCPARLIPEKNHETLLQAIAILRSRGVSLHLALVGSGPLRAHTEERCADLELSEVVSIHSSMPHPALMQWVQAADVVVLASEFEGLGLALAEGMAMQRAVIGTRGTGMEDLVEHGKSGLLVPRRDVASMAEAIARLAASAELRQTFGQAARERIADMLDSRTIARSWATLLRQVRAQATIS